MGCAGPVGSTLTLPGGVGKTVVLLVFVSKGEITIGGVDLGYEGLEGVPTTNKKLGRILVKPRSKVVQWYNCHLMHSGHTRGDAPRNDVLEIPKIRRQKIC